MYMRHFALASQINFCENAHGGPSRVTGKVCLRKRRQCASEVDGNDTPHPPDDPASRSSVKTEPSTSGLVSLGLVRIPSAHQAKTRLSGAGLTSLHHSRGPSHETSRKRRKPKPADPGAPAACTLWTTKAWRSSHARGNLKPACFPNRTEAAKAAPVLSCLSCLDPSAYAPATCSCTRQ